MTQKTPSAREQELQKLRDDKQAELHTIKLTAMRKQAERTGDILWEKCKKAAASGESRLLVHEVSFGKAEEQQILVSYLENELGLRTKVERNDTSMSGDPHDYSYEDYLYIIW